jgi:hypothetical protein
MQRPTPLLPTVTTPINLWPYKSWAKGNLVGGGTEPNKKNRGKQEPGRKGTGRVNKRNETES